MSDKSTKLAPITPYYASKVTAMRLAAEGLLVDGRKAPQGPRFFGMRKSGTIKVSETDPKSFDGDDFKRWLDEYVGKVRSGETASRVDINELAAKYM